MKNYFKISDFVIIGDKLPLEVADKILKHHIEPLSLLRATVIDFPIFVSMNSGYRPYNYEKKKGRSGNSPHTFKGLGACDLTCEGSVKDLYNLLVKYSKYKRICYYPNSNFVHCDYEDTPHRTFIDVGNGWQRV